MNEGNEAMTRMTDILNGLELAAKKLKMSVEEAVDVLLGVHPTHTVVQAHATEAQKEEAKAETAAKVEAETTAPAAAAPNAPAVVATVGTTGPATTTISTSVETTTTTEPGAAA